MVTSANEDFEGLPTRVFLDPSTLQTLLNYGGFIWENEEIEPRDRIHRIPGGRAELDALRSIFFVAQRAPFEFALLAASLGEVAAAGRVPGYLSWALDVLDHWDACLSAYGSDAMSGSGQLLAHHLDSPPFGYLGAKDRRLLRDAVELECDAFLTMERKLPKNADHIRREVGLWVASPTDWWLRVQPWARLWV